MRPRLSVCLRACAPARCGLRLICCLRNTITFLLSDRVSRHTRDRARQCALETGDGARAPKPSSSFTDGEPSAPSQITRRLASFHSHTQKNFATELGLFYFRGRGCEASVSGRVTRGSLSLARFPPPLSPSLFSNRVRDPWLDLLPDSRPGSFLPHPPQKSGGFPGRSRIEKPPLLCAVGSRILWINAPEDGRAPLFFFLHGENCERLSA